MKHNTLPKLDRKAQAGTVSVTMSASHQPRPLWMRVLAYYLCFMFVVPVDVLAQLTPAAVAAAQTPRVDAAPNNVPLVQIATPNARNVSINQWQQFNVGPQGIIFNNAATSTVNTRLAGWIDGNPNLNGRAAGIIINQVLGTDPSALRGFMEVAGQKAELIIANPNGISCNGCGFINTSRGVLTTGTPQYDGAGGLTGFNVDKGRAIIEGLGLNALEADATDILARAVQINAGVYANQLNVITGASQVDYATLNTRPTSASETAPSSGFSLDVAAIGGMYANKIRLVGSESGLGVNQGGVVQSIDSMQINAAGQLTLGGVTQAGGNLSLSAQQINNSGLVSAGGSVTLSTTGLNKQISNSGVILAGADLTLNSDQLTQTSSGQLAAGVDAFGVLSQAGHLTLNIANNAALQGDLLAGGNTSVTANGTLDMRQSRIRGQNISLRSVNGDLILNQADVAAKGSEASQQGQLMLQGQNISAQQAQLVASGTASYQASAQLDHSGATTQASRVNIQAGSLNNDGGTILALDSTSTDANGVVNALNLNVSANVSNLNNGLIGTNGNLNLQAGSLANGSSVNGGQIVAGNDIALSLGSSDFSYSAQSPEARPIRRNGGDSRITPHRQDTQGVINSGNNLSLSTTGTVTISGDLLAANQLTLNTGNLNNSGILSGAQVNLNTRQTLTNSGQINAVDTLTSQATNTNNTGILLGDTTLLRGGNLNNIGMGALVGAYTDAILDFTGTITNQNNGGTFYTPGGLIFAGRNLSVSANSLVNSSSTLQALNDFSLNANTVLNKRDSWDIGYTTAVSSVTVAPANYAEYNFSLVGDEKYRNVTTITNTPYFIGAAPEGQLLAGRDLHLTSSGSVTNDLSSILAARNFLIEGGGTVNNKSYNYATTQQRNYDRFYEVAVAYRCGFRTCHRNEIQYGGSGTQTAYLPGITLVGSLSGGQTVAIDSPNFNNATQSNAPSPVVSRISNSAIVLPNNPVFSQNANPSARYLVETNPAFTQYSNFISSDYLVSRLGLNSASVTKRLGDGYYEQQYVLQQINKFTGQRYLNSLYAQLEAQDQPDDMRQYTALMDSGITQAQQFNFVLGVALSPAQMAALTQDMVWLVNETVTLADGSPQTVLAPKLYLAPSSAELQWSRGALVAGRNVQLQVDNLRNQGTIRANDQVQAQARQDIHNDGGEIKSRNTTLLAGRDIINTGGKLSGSDNLALGAGRDLISQDVINTFNTAHTGTGPKGASVSSQSQTQIRAAVGTLEGGNISVQTGRDINFTGGQINATGDVSLNAGGNVLLNAAQTTDSAETQFSSGHYDANSNLLRIRKLGTQVQAGNNMNIQANNGMFYAEGADVRAANNLSLSAGQVVLLARTDIDQSSNDSNTRGKSSHVHQDSRYQETATGTVLQAKTGNLSLASSGDTLIQGSALDAGQQASLNVGGNLQLLAAVTQRSQSVFDYDQNKKRATTLKGDLQETRQLLATITAGQGMAINVQGNLQADVGTVNSQGQLEADRMTADGVIKGASRQQINIQENGQSVSSSRAFIDPDTGKPYQNTSLANVPGNRSDKVGEGLGQALQNLSYTPNGSTFGRSLTGQAAINALVTQGVLTVSNNPQIQQLLAQPNANAAPTTYKDAQGNISLTVAGQAKVQEVYNQLRLTETFDVTKFKDQQTAQIATLVVAIALTICTAGAGAALIGAVAGTMSAAMANAAFIAIVSTTVGQMAGGASFQDAFKAGVKSGAIAAVTAGVTYGVNDALGVGYQANPDGSIMTDAAGKPMLTGAGRAYEDMSAFGKLGTSTFWAQTGASATTAGLISKAQGGSFENAFLASAVSSLGRSANTAVGDWAKGANVAEGDWSKVLMHSGIGAVQSALLKQNIAAGAIGGGTAELLSPLNDKLDAATGNKLASELLTVGGAAAANSLLNSKADFATNLQAAYQAQQTDRNNRQLHSQEKSILRKIAEEKAKKEFATRSPEDQRSLANKLYTILEAEAVAVLDKREGQQNAQYRQDLANTQQDGLEGRYYAGGELSLMNWARSQIYNLQQQYGNQTIQLNGQDIIANGGKLQFFRATTEQYNDSSLFNTSAYVTLLRQFSGNGDANQTNAVVDNALRAARDGSIKQVDQYQQNKLERMQATNGGVVPNTIDLDVAMLFGGVAVNGAKALVTKVGEVSQNKLVQKAEQAAAEKAAADAIKQAKIDNNFYEEGAKVDISALPKQQAEALANLNGKTLQSGWTPQRVYDEVINVPKGQRPLPETYLSLSEIDNKLMQFQDGVTKIKASSPSGTEGPPGGTFVMPKSVADNLIKQADGDVGKLEQLLGLNKGDLGTMPVRVDIPNPQGLRLPSGNELGAKNLWIPGGKTSGGIPEATINPVPKGQYTVSPIK